MKPQKQYKTFKSLIYDRHSIKLPVFQTQLDRFIKQYDITDTDKIMLVTSHNGDYEERCSEIQFQYTRIETDEEFEERVVREELDLKVKKSQNEEYEKQQYERLHEKYGK